MTNETQNRKRRIGAFRHHKQRFDPEARFIWRKRRLVGGEVTVVGELVDTSTISDGKLRSFWRAGLIELADFVPPSRAGRLDAAACTIGLSMTGRGYYTLTLLEPQPPTVVDGEEVAGEPKEHTSQARGLGTLLDRAERMGVRDRVELLVEAAKAAGGATVFEGVDELPDGETETETETETGEGGGVIQGVKPDEPPVKDDGSTAGGEAETTGDGASGESREGAADEPGADAPTTDPVEPSLTEEAGAAGEGEVTPSESPVEGDAQAPQEAAQGDVVGGGSEVADSSESTEAPTGDGEDRQEGGSAAGAVLDTAAESGAGGGDPDASDVGEGVAGGASPGDSPERPTREGAAE